MSARERTASAAELARARRAVALIPVHFQARPEDLIELSHGGGLLVVLVALLSGLALAFIAAIVPGTIVARTRGTRALHSE